MFKYRASVGETDMGPAEGQKRASRGKRLATREGHVMALGSFAQAGRKVNWSGIFEFWAMERVPRSRSSKFLVTHPRLQRYLTPPPFFPTNSS